MSVDLREFPDCVRTHPDLPERLRERFERGENDTWFLVHDVDCGAYKIGVEVATPAGRRYVAYTIENPVVDERTIGLYLPRIDYVLHELLAGRWG